jgi:hypothetical protein
MQRSDAMYKHFRNQRWPGSVAMTDKETEYVQNVLKTLPRRCYRKPRTQNEISQTTLMLADEDVQFYGVKMLVAIVSYSNRDRVRLKSWSIPDRMKRSQNSDWEWNNMPSLEGEPCHCGSGKPCSDLYDARGIFCSYVDILEDSNYECDEPIEPEDNYEDTRRVMG